MCAFQLFNQLLLINGKFFFLNIFATRCNSVHKRVKNVFSHTLLHYSLQNVKYFIKLKGGGGGGERGGEGGGG